MVVDQPARSWAAARFSIFAQTLGILALAFAVFAWGLQYKLSLYDVHPSNSIPVAKLVTGKSDAQHLVQQAAQTQIKPVFPALQLDLLVILSALSLLSLHAFLFPRSVRISLRPQRASLDHFAFRPPPFIS
jgi:hypothetical protein